jgi:uncharacterized membrane protein (Fun14 family)
MVVLRSLWRASRPQLVILGMITSAVPVNTFCENNKDDWLSKDEKGNIDWQKTISNVSLPSLNTLSLDDAAATAGTKVQSIIDSGFPTQISYGFICGYCSGYAMKKVGKVASVVFGLGFMGLQTLSYQGYIEVDHNVIKKSVESWLDLNVDGKVDDKDGALAYNKLMEVLTYNLPAGSGFSAGFVGGIRSG